MTPKQKALVDLMPEVESGKMTMQQAMLEAGYAESTAHQQSTILGGLRTNSKMQDALEKAGFTEEYLAEGIVEGTKASGGLGGTPDHSARARYFKLGAELKDSFPAKKQINATVGVEAMLDSAEDEADYAEFQTTKKEKE